MKEYHDLVRKVLLEGNKKTDRTGTGTLSLFGLQTRIKVSENRFPLITTKKLNYRAIINEFIWMVCKGSTDVTWLEDQGHKFWSPWKGEDGTIGKGYGYQFRKIPKKDQVQDLIGNLMHNPDSRRHLVNLWNVKDLDDMTLPPCHNQTQWYVNNGKLSVQLYIRSNDLFLGCPFNIAFYSLFLLVIAQLTGLEADEIIYTIGDAHIYVNHIDQCMLQISRETYPLPSISINKNVKSINDFIYDDFIIKDYKAHPHIKGDIAI